MYPNHTSDILSPCLLIKSKSQVLPVVREKAHTECELLEEKTVETAIMVSVATPHKLTE